MKSEEIFESIDIIFDIFKGIGAEPVFFGSLTAAALNNGFYREIGDIDIIAEARYKNKIENYFKNAGFKGHLNKDVGFICVLGACPVEFSDGKRSYSFIFGSYKKDYFQFH